MACRRRSSQPIRFRTEQQHDCMGRRHLLGALLLPARRTAVPPCPLRRLLHSSAERPTLPRAKQKQGILAYRAGRMHQNTRVTLTRAEVPPPPPQKTCPPWHRAGHRRERHAVGADPHLQNTVSDRSTAFATPSNGTSTSAAAPGAVHVAYERVHGPRDMAWLWLQPPSEPNL